MLAIAPGSFIDDVWENNALPASRNSGFPPSHLSAASFLLAGVVFTVHDALGTASVAIRPATLSILKSGVRLKNNCRNVAAQRARNNTITILCARHKDCDRMLDVPGIPPPAWRHLRAMTASNAETTAGPGPSHFPSRVGTCNASWKRRREPPAPPRIYAHRTPPARTVPTTDERLPTGKTRGRRARQNERQKLVRKSRKRARHVPQTLNARRPPAVAARAFTTLFDSEPAPSGVDS